LKAFARHLKPYLPGILAHCRRSVGTNLIEGINTGSRRSSGWLTASAMTPISSSKSGRRFPEFGEEPFFA